MRSLIRRRVQEGALQEGCSHRRPYHKDTTLTIHAVDPQGFYTFLCNLCGHVFSYGHVPPWDQTAEDYALDKNKPRVQEAAVCRHTISLYPDSSLVHTGTLDGKLRPIYRCRVCALYFGCGILSSRDETSEEYCAHRDIPGRGIEPSIPMPTINLR